MFVGAFLEVLGLGAIPVFVSIIGDPSKIENYETLDVLLGTLGISGKKDLLLWGAAGLLLVYTLKNAFLALVYYAQARLTLTYQVNIRDRLFSAYMCAPFSFVLDYNTAELLRNVNAESKRVIDGIVNPLLSFTLQIVMTLLIVLFLVFSYPLTTLVVLGVLGGGSALFVYAVRSRADYHGGIAQEEERNSIQAVNQGLGGFKEVRVSGREAYFIDAFKDSIEKYAVSDLFKRFVQQLATPILETLIIAGFLGLTVILFLSGQPISAIAPTLALFGAAIVRLRSTVSTSVQRWTSIRYTNIAIDPIYYHLNKFENAEEGEILESESASKLPFDEILALNNISFWYPDAREPALKNIDLEIPRGSSVAFVGATGAGKTTLINVLLGLLQPHQGEIKVDGVDIEENLRGWRANVGYIPQSIYLLDDTIRRNIAFGMKDETIDEGRLWRAIRAAQLEDFINSLEHGLDTVTGERGVRLSGGQQQRVGIARALYRNPEVLVMDEATSSLDNITERSLMQAMHRLKKERTVIMIAHRLSTVQDCDRLYFLRDGRIEAEGTYDELRERHSAFREMARV